MREAGIRTRQEANRFLADYLPRHNKRFAVTPQETGTAFVPYTGTDLDKIFSRQCERVIGNDNTISIDRLRLQIEQQTFRFSMAKCRVLVCQHLDGTLSVHYGPHRLGRYDADGRLLVESKSRKDAA